MVVMVQHNTCGIGVSFWFCAATALLVVSSSRGERDGRTDIQNAHIMYVRRTRHTPARQFCIRQHQLAIEQEDEDWRRRRNLCY